MRSPSMISLRMLPRFLPLLLLCPMAEADDEAKKSHPLVGTADARGNLILHVFSAGMGEDRPAALVSDYGVVLCRSRDWVLFVMADRARQRVLEFTTYGDFEKALASLPKGSEITVYDRCLLPEFYDFYPVHEELGQKFRRTCTQRGLKVAEDTRTTCTCTATAPPEPAKAAPAGKQ
jgi:hypothetical protein